MASETCELTAEAIERGYPKTADVNYVCYPHRCPRRENIMQLYNGLLEENQTVKTTKIYNWGFHVPRRKFPGRMESLSTTQFSKNILVGWRID